jgi:ELWxxDGT repeat protein
MLFSATLVGDINVGGASSVPRNAVDVNGTLFFGADDGVHGEALWKSDGTEAGTVLVKAVAPDYLPFRDSVLTAVNGIVYFTARDAATGDELWKSDGTPEGTAMVADIAPGAASSSPSELTSFRGALYFLVGTAAGPGQLWKTDGTAQGTVEVAALPPDGDPRLIAGNDTLFVTTDLHLYGVDPSGSITALGPGPHYYLDDLANLLRPSCAVLGPDLYYLAEQRVNGIAKPVMYRSDGTAAGTTQVIDLTSEAFYAGTYFGAAGGRLFFSISDKLWSSDGTPSGTVPLQSGYLTSAPTSAAGTVFLAAFDTIQHNELVKTDGTPAGTAVLKTFPSDAPGASPSNLTNFAGKLFFNATYPGELWQSDGTPDGTQQVMEIPAGVSSAPILAPSGGRLFFDGVDTTHGMELWKLELPGTISGSVFVDVNHDGRREPGEPNLPGVTVYLDANGNGQLDPGEFQAATDSGGNYAFFNVPAGTYTVRQVPAAGYALTAPLGYSAQVVAGDVVESGPVFGDVPISSVPMDFGYLLTLAQHYGQPGTFATGDANGDGLVNFDDLLLVAQNYGHPLSNLARRRPGIARNTPD